MHAHPRPSPEAIRASADRTFGIEIQALQALQGRIDARFAQAVGLILDCPGRVVVTGIGKSGHVARKIAATLASTGTPAFFMHAAEAIHGDLGMLTGQDILLAISYSGSAQELITIISVAKRMGTRIIALTGHAGSELAISADLTLDAAVDQEACPLNLAPTASTTAALVLGDAIAVACLEPQFFEAFARLLPLDETFANAQYDVGLWPDMRAAIAARVAERSRDEWWSVFAETDACVAPVLSLCEAQNHPHNLARGTFRREGKLVRAAPAPRFSRSASTPAAPPAATTRGSERIPVLEAFGIASSRAKALAMSGVIGE
jgi:D-arabinose 5-phosphate isomerase GutQ